MASKFWSVALIVCVFCLGWGHSVSATNLEDAATRGIQLYWAQEDEDALEFLNEALALDSDNVDALVYRGAVHLYNYDYDDAEADLEAALALNPDSALAHSFRAMFWMRKTLNHTRARDEALQAIDLDPQSSALYYNLGVIYTEMENPSKANDAFSKGLEVDTGEYPALTARLYIYHSRIYKYSDPTRALDELNKALALWPNGSWVLYERASFYIYSPLYDYDRAEADLEVAIKLDPEDIDALLLRAELYIFTEQFEEAVDMANEVLRLNPNSLRALSVRGRAYGWMGESELALNDLNAALEGFPSNIDMLINRGFLYSSLGQNEEAFQDFNRAVSLDRNNPFALMYRGVYYLETDQYELALADFNKAELDPEADLFFIWRVRGDLYRLMEEYDLALIDLNRVLEIEPDNTFALGTRGAVLIELGDYDGAIEDLVTSLEIDPWDSFAREMLRRAEALQKEQEEDN